MTMRAGLFDDVVKAGVDRFGMRTLIEFVADGSSVEIDGVFDREFERIEFSNGAEVMSTGPRVGIRVADLPRTPARGDVVTVDGTVFEVDEVLPDGQAGIALDLIEPEPTP